MVHKDSVNWIKLLPVRMNSAFHISGVELSDFIRNIRDSEIKKWDNVTCTRQNNTREKLKQ